MKVQLEEVSPIVRRLTVEIEPDQVDQALAEAYLGLSRSVRIKGFRPGKAPRRILEQSYKEQVEREVVGELVRRTYPKAAQEKSLSPVAEPVVENDELRPGAPFRYRARVEVKPKLDPQGYRGLPLKRRPSDVTEAQVDEELEKLRQSLATLVPIDGRQVGVTGDWALIDYDLDMPPGAPGLERNRDTPVEIAPGTIIAGFVPELAGVEVGARIDIPFTFPSDYKIEALRGRSTHFHVTLKSLRCREVPSLDDEMVKDLDESGLATLADLRQRLRERLVREAEAEATRDRDDQILKALVEKNPFEAPPALLERLVETQLRRVAERIVQAGIDPSSVSIDQQKLRENAELRIKGELLLEAIADKEGLGVADADVDAFVEKVAKDEEAPIQKVRAQFSRAPARQALVAKLREDKTLAFLASQALVQEG
ncbi:MAG: trigger factor [Deltaproteobacteria bacterium]